MLTGIDEEHIFRGFPAFLEYQDAGRDAGSNIRKLEDHVLDKGKISLARWLQSAILAESFIRHELRVGAPLC
jgi:hypothetical protein